MEGIKPTQRQVKIVQLLANDNRQEEIGQHLGVSVRTVEYELKKTKAQFGLKSPTGVCIYFYKKGWIS